MAGMKRTKAKAATKKTSRKAAAKSTNKQPAAKKKPAQAKLPKRRTTSKVPEVTNVTKHGFWLLLRRTQYFVPFLDYPKFRRAPTPKLLNVKELSSRRVHWPDLDITIPLSSLVQPDGFSWMESVSLADLQAAADPSAPRVAPTPVARPKVDITRN